MPLCLLFVRTFKHTSSLLFASILRAPLHARLALLYTPLFPLLSSRLYATSSSASGTGSCLLSLEQMRT